VTTLRALRADPQAEVISLLESQLELARRGTLQAVVVLSDTNEGKTGEFRAGRWNYGHLLLALECLKHDCLRDAIDG